jgi:DNA polymerase I
MKGILFDIDYSDERELVRLYLRAGRGWVVADDRDFKQCFFVTGNNPEKLARLISKLRLSEDGSLIKPQKVELVECTRLGVPVRAIKVVLEKPKHLQPLRRAVRELPGVTGIYGFDIPISKRYLIEHGLRPMDGVEIKVDDQMRVLSKPKAVESELPDLSILSFDIEVYNPTGAPRPEQDPVLVISLAGNDGFRRVLTWKHEHPRPQWVEVLEDERAMIRRFIQLVEERDVDILLGYNTDFFDFPYLKERAKHLKLKLALGRDGSDVISKRRRFATATRVRGRIHVDVYAIVNFLATIGNIRLIHYTLEDVYRYVTGKEKPDFEFTRFTEAWERGGELWRRLLEYSLSDAEATLELGMEFLPLFIQISKTVGQTLFDTTRMTPGQLVEWLLVSEAHRRGELVPPRPVGGEYEERVEETYTGAYVMEPVRGLHENLVVFDFRSLYPSIIVTHNIDPSTVNCKCCGGSGAPRVPELGYHICVRRRGFIPEVLERMIEMRARLKRRLRSLKPGSREYIVLNAQQWALKVISNSFYGVLGYPRARWYSREAAESVTSYGRHYIHQSIAEAERFGLRVIYSDTDSLHCALNGLSKEDALRFMKELNQKLPGLIELELEGFYPRAVYVTKKRYAMIDEEGRITVKGLEFVRRDWAQIAKRTQQAVLEAILREGSKERAAEIVRAVTRQIQKGEVDLSDLIIYTQLKMPIESYKSIGPHVAAAKRLRERGIEVEPGMVIGYVVTRGSGSISDRAVPVELLGGRSYDPDYYVEHQVLPAVMRIMEVLGYSEESLRFQRSRQRGLTEFIS